MPYTAEGKEIMLWNLAATISHASLHSGPPPQGNEIRGGVYRRMRIDFVDPANGKVRSERVVEFDVPALAKVTHVGFWTNSISGVLLAWGVVTEKTFRGRGVYVIDLAEMNLDQEQD